MALGPPSSAPSSVLLPFMGGRPRRGSLTSLSSTKGDIDKDALSQALDNIHSSASRSETLTSFHDFDGGAPRSGAKEIVSSGITGLYDKYIRGLGNGTPVKESKARPRGHDLKGSTDTGSVRSNESQQTEAPPIKSPAIDAVSVNSTKSAAASPRSTNLSSQAQLGPEAGCTYTRTESQRKATHSTVSKVDNDTDAETTNAKDALDRRKTQGARESIPREEPIRGRDGLSGIERKDTAAEALARVISQHDIPIADEPKKPWSLHATNEKELGADNSDTARDTLRSPSAPPAAVSNARITFGDIGHLKDDQLPQPDTLRPPMTRQGVSHLPGYAPSRASSADGGDAASVSSFQAKARLEPAPNLNSGLQRNRAGANSPPSQLESLGNVPLHLKRRVISKAFWMKDENAKDCFYCGQAFSTFRRKHHCRTCGQIFDAKCTNLVPGRPFGQAGAIRLCKPCEAMVYGSDDDSTVFSDDASEFRRTPVRRRLTGDHDQLPEAVDDFDDDDADVAEVATPSIGIPASRRNREAKRRSAIIEFNAAPTLPRPTSSHSLISLARRPRSSSHRRQNSRHQNLRGLRGPMEDRVPFQPGSMENNDKSSALPAFHNDNIIDPDLAPFASDEGSDEDDQPNIISAMDGGPSASPADRERMGVGAFAAAANRRRPRHGTASSTRTLKEDDPLVQATKHLPKLSRHHNPSMGSMSYGRSSPRRSRNNILMKQAIDPESFDRGHESSNVPPGGTRTRLVRSSSLRGRDAPPVELNRASLDHLRRLLTQLLNDNHIDHRAAWEKALIPILLQCTDDVEPNVQVGDDMDIRHYIKLKKVAGGRPGDTSYVSGVVFSKNIALKSMSRSISQPHIAIVTFPIEYARHHAHFMSLEPVIAQEKEYLRNLVGRISALKPNILFVQRNVSGTALDLLEKAGITVAYNIKESVLAAVARVTQTTMIKSVDKLAIDPSHLGTCDSFEIKTYVSEGVRKSYVYLSGCEPELGCTVVLRGADLKTLRMIKRITEFMCYVAYNLKLETNLFRDQFVSIPSDAPVQLAAPDTTQHRSGTYSALSLEKSRSNGAVNGRVDLDRDDASKYEKLEFEARSRILSASPFVIFMQPYLLTQLRESERRLTTYKQLRDQYAAADEEGDQNEKTDKTRFELVKPEMVHTAASKDQPKAVRDYLHAVHEAQLEKTMHTYDTQKRLMDSFMSVSADPFDPHSHQTIVVLQSTVSTVNSAPCIGPELLGIGFYAGFRRVEPQFEEDCTLGQYVEDQYLSANTACKECGKKMYDHHRQYVHGYGQISISVQRQPAKMRGYQKTILMWATCRICKHETTVTPMSDNTWKYSFAKYLELSFWSGPLHPRAGVCQHDIHKDFLRCFGFEELVVCVQYDPIEIYDVVVPRARITWSVEADLKVKNEQYSRFVARLNAFTESIKKRLDSINVDTLDEKKSMEAHDVLDELRKRAKEDHAELLEKLRRKYADSRYYEVIPLNRALRFMDEKALEWDDTFSDFERDYFPSETDIRKLATLQLRNMFLESQPPTSTISASSDVSDDEEIAEKPTAPPKFLKRGLTAPAISSEKVHDVLTSTVEEHRNIVNGINDRKEEAVESGDPAVVKKMSPREEQEQAVEREDVKHLDLAVLSKSSDDINSDGVPNVEDGAVNLSRPTTREGDPTEEPFATHTRAMGTGLMERIEQIRSNRPTSGHGENEVTESKIPRLTSVMKRDVSPKPSPPPIVRALSSPSSPKHAQRRSGDLTSEPNIDSVISGTITQEANPEERRLGERLGVTHLAGKVSKATASLIPRSIPANSDDINNKRVSALAKHFEQMSREFEKERLRERRQRALRSRMARAKPLASSRPVVEVYRNATDALGQRELEQAKAEIDASKDQGSDIPPDDTGPPVQLTSPDDYLAGQPENEPSSSTNAAEQHFQPDSDEEEGDSDSDLDRPGARRRDASDAVPSPPPSGLASPNSGAEIELPSEMTIPEHKKNVWFKYLAEFWSRRTASGWINLEYPLRSTEHVFEDADIIVREDEPSSVIALSLACSDYLVKVQEFRSHPKKHAKKASQSSSQAADSLALDDLQKAIEASLLSDTGTHMRYSFAHGPVKASCKIFYAEAFDALRRRCGVADRFVESLSRCLKFDSKGGKTKSIFLKTLDNRFYIKSLQEVELKAFTKFAPDYFAFMSHTLFHGVPSVIAKMFGLFQVIIKNPATGVDFSYYLLVMENLFYERTPNRRFDLKGSMRNRKIESTGKPDEVLLDENLVETIFESPLFVREHARKLLQASVWNDTMWLCKQNVMDYSLMAGFDDQGKELIVGIIDCIRTYTWDKKLESWIKDRGKNKPTITSPKDYRNRFRVSMMQYVLQAPSPWSRFSGEMDIAGRLPPNRNAQGADKSQGSADRAEFIQPQLS